jgi:hypothetical protein
MNKQPHLSRKRFTFQPDMIGERRLIYHPIAAYLASQETVLETSSRTYRGSN